jgi:peptidoglycan/xylan/chitin deacetylase (PgdA/CDA1 family)
MITSVGQNRWASGKLEKTSGSMGGQERRLKQIFLRWSKWVGLFWIARRLTRCGLRILCYHSFGVGDEVEFRPKLFIRPGTFEERLQILRAQGIPVLSVTEATKLLQSDRLPDFATALTIDDGFDSVERYAAQLLQQYSFHATVYITTYYCLKQTPVFRLLVQYIFWKTRKRSVEFPSDIIASCTLVDLADAVERDRIMWAIINKAEEMSDETERERLSQRLSRVLDVDIRPVIQSRVFHIMDLSQIKSLVVKGIDVQLHTHRHRFPVDPEHAAREIRDNRAVLKTVVSEQLEHFCYPSGIWSERHWPVLAAAGIRSATTCDPGVNYPSTPPLGLKRFLDSEDISRLEFEAELSGYAELLRRLRNGIRTLLSRSVTLLRI